MDTLTRKGARMNTKVGNPSVSRSCRIRRAGQARPGRSPRRALRDVCAILALIGGLLGPARAQEPGREGLFGRDNLVAWCIVPYDGKKRGPEERAAMLDRLGFRRFAYDWRAEHV